MHPVATCHFRAPLGDRIADSTPQKLQRPRGNGYKCRESNFRHKDGGSADVSQKEENNLQTKKKQPKNKSWSHWNILFDFWFTRSGTSSMISIACMYAPSLSWGVFVFNKIPSLHHLSNKRKKKRKRFKLPDGTQVKQQSSSYTHWLVTCQRVCGDRLKITVENWQQLIGG